MTNAESPAPQQVPEDWSRALAVVAHPDDLEFGSASAIARWTDQGKAITYCLVTSGEAGIDSMPPDEAAVVRQAEERASAAADSIMRTTAPRASHCSMQHVTPPTAGSSPAPAANRGRA